MAAPIRSVLRGIIDLALADSEVTDAEINSALDQAVLAVRGVLLVASAATTPAAGQTVAVPTGFVYVYGVELGNEALPPQAWWITDGTSPVITFNKAFFQGAAPSGTLTVSGGTFQEILSGDSSVLYIDPDYIIARALATLHSSRGGTASDLADWHKSEHSKWAAIAEQRFPWAVAAYGPPDGARLVKGRLTAA